MIAVLAVVLFHISVPGLDGGFVGVDVFFTISGFLITKNVLDRKRAGTFTFRDFYSRRIRRLFPSLGVTLLATAVIGIVLLSPHELRRLGEEALFSLFPLSNFYFAASQDYFAPEAHARPLLHTWSLSVEEQFYLVWPAALVLLVTMWPRRITAIIASIFVVSLLATGTLTSIFPVEAFYWTPFRVYEFAIGALVASSGVIDQRRRGFANLLFVVGLLAILLSIVAIRANDAFPGFVALLPCAGAALVIYANDARLGRWLLGNAASQYIGKISYCLYLTHWPIIVLYLAVNPGDLDWVERLLLFAASLASAALLSAFVEQPLLHKKGAALRLPGKRFAYAAATGVFVCTATFLSLRVASPAIKYPFMSPFQVNLMQALASEPGDECRETDEPPPSGFTCRFGAASYTRTVALIGDSHSEHFRPGLHDLFKRHDIRGLGTWGGGCIPILGVEIARDDIPNAALRQRECHDFARTAIRSAGEHADVAVLAARWSVYIGDEASQGGYVNILGPGSKAIASRKHSELVLEKYLDVTLRYFRDRSVKVVLVPQIPPLGINRGLCLSNSLFRDPDKSCRGFDRDKSLETTNRSYAILRRVAAKYDHVTIVPISESLCPPDRDYCTDTIEGVFLYRDDDHLNAMGSKALVRAKENQLLEAMQR